MDVAVPRPHSLLDGRDLHRLRRTVVLGGVAACTAAAAALGAAGATSDPAMRGLLRGAMVAAPLGLGLYARRLPAYAAIGRLLVAVGAVAFVTALAETRDPTLYSAGRTAGWALEVLLVCVLLAFPSGRLDAPIDRALAAAAAVVTAAFFCSTLPIAEAFRVPSPFTACTSDCPPNAFVLAPQPAVAAALLRVGSVAIFFIMLAVVARLQQRIAGAGPLQRQMLVPVLAVGMLHVALVGSALVLREAGGGATVLARTSTWLIAWSTPLIALSFLVALLQARLFAEGALRRLTTCVRATPDLATLRRALADALEDPTVQIALPRPGLGAWTDAHGDDLDLREAGETRSVHLVPGRHGLPVAALLGDRDLAERPELLAAAAELIAVAVDNLQLTADAAAAAREAQASRARIAASADRERRRIERDLHDGAQQRLVALRIELSLVEDLAHRDPDRCAARLRDLEGDVDAALDELRSLAHGACPPLLADRGLAEALRAAASRSPIPVALELQQVSRYAPELESAVYFCVLEALQNVAKHARGAHRATLALDGGGSGELRFTVRDDGAGSAEGQLRGGAGITNMRDRMGALGGDLDVRSRPGLGTVVRGRVPVPEPRFAHPVLQPAWP